MFGVISVILGCTELSPYLPYPQTVSWQSNIHSYPLSALVTQLNMMLSKLKSVFLFPLREIFGEITVWWMGYILPLSPILLLAGKVWQLQPLPRAITLAWERLLGDTPGEQQAVLGLTEHGVAISLGEAEPQGRHVSRISCCFWAQLCLLPSWPPRPS